MEGEVIQIRIFHNDKYLGLFNIGGGYVLHYVEELLEVFYKDGSIRIVPNEMDFIVDEGGFSSIYSLCEGVKFVHTVDYEIYESILVEEYGKEYTKNNESDFRRVFLQVINNLPKLNIREDLKKYLKI